MSVLTLLGTPLRLVFYCIFWDFVLYFQDYVLCRSDALYFVLGYICISVKNIVIV